MQEAPAALSRGLCYCNTSFPCCRPQMDRLHRRAVLHLPLFYRPVDGTFQREHLGEQLVDSCPQLSGLGGHLLELLPLLLDTPFQLRKLLLPRWLLTHAPGHQVFEFLCEVLPRLPLDQLPKLIRKPDTADVCFIRHGNPSYCSIVCPLRHSLRSLCNDHILHSVQRLAIYIPLYHLCRF